MPHYADNDDEGGHVMKIETVELDDKAWAEAQDAITMRFLHVPAAVFVEKYLAGAYDEAEPDFLMDVLAYFPDLD